MQNTDFDPYQTLINLARNQEKITKNHHEISLFLVEMTRNYNDLNLRLCIAQNTIDELEITLDQLKKSQAN